MQYANAPTFTIRGINVNDFTATTVPAAALYVDGVYRMANVSSGAQLFDIERVEILKGPQGTLWGKNTTGGAINVLTVAPDQARSGYLRASYGAFDRVDLEGAIGGGITDRVAGRLSVQYVRSDGPFRNVTHPTTGIEPGAIPPPPPLDGSTGPPPELVEFSGYRARMGALGSLALRGQLLLEPSAWASIRLIAHHTSDSGESFPYVSRFEDPDPFDQDVSHDLVLEKDNRASGFVADVRLAAGPGELVSITAWDAFRRRDDGVDFSNSSGNTGGNQLLIPAATPFGAQLYWQALEQLSQELRYEVQGGRYFWMIGGYYAAAEYDNASGSNRSIGLFDSYFDVPYLQSDETVAVFAHLDFDVSRVLNLHAGLRYNDEKRDRERYQTFLETGDPATDVFESPALAFPTTLLADARGPNAFGEVNEFPNRVHSKDWSYRFGVDVRPAEGALLYLSYSKGLKSGGFDNGPVLSNDLLEPVDDEIVRGFELGVKWEPLAMLRLNAAVFGYDYEDLQQRQGLIDPVFGPVQKLTNFSRVDVSGAEVEGVWAPVSGLMLMAAASWLNTEIADDSKVSASTGESY